MTSVRTRVMAASAGGLTILAAACGDGGRRPLALPDSVTFAQHVAPILHANCVRCHRDQGAAPFSLVTAEEAAPWAAAIAAAVTERRMPPWLPAQTDYPLRGARRLSEHDVGVLGRWAELGAPAGDTAQVDLPPLPTSGWQLGEPDLIVRFPEPYVLRPGPHDVFRNFPIAIPIEETKYVRNLEFRPTPAHAVHHAIFNVDETGSTRHLDQKDPGPGYDGMFLAGEQERPGGWFLGWTPGTVPQESPPGFAWTLRPGTDLVVEGHLRPGAEPVDVSAEIGFHFTDRPPSKPAYALTLGTFAIDIPAGKKKYAVEDSYRMPVDVELLSLYPHAHYLGSKMTITARFPGARPVTLLAIPRWDFDWQDIFWFEEPVQLPRGTVLTMAFEYDNSAANPRNPHDPPRRITWGPESDDEMANLFTGVMVRDSQDLATLHLNYSETYARKNLEGFAFLVEARPADPTAHNLYANALRQAGRIDEALAEYREAIRLKPDYAQAYYNLGTTLAAQRNLAEAITAFQRTLAIDPTYAQAHTNLGNAFQVVGRLESAVRHYRAALEARPRDAITHYNLGLTLLRTGDPRGAADHLTRAADLASTELVPVTTAVRVLATHPNAAARRPADAIRLAERASDLTGGTHPAVLDLLAAAYASAGRYADAIETAERALGLARDAGAQSLAREIEERLRLYRQGRPFRQEAATNP